jgi:site-specific DNA-methyltransferase (adenine-specific)
LALSDLERSGLQQRLSRLSGPVQVEDIVNKTVHQNLFDLLAWLPAAFVDLLILDPPYNLTKAFHGTPFSSRSVKEYEQWLESWFPGLLRTLKPHASVYICSDWRSSTAVHLVAERYLKVRNRVTWEREKGRGARANWKNCSEDIWFCTNSDKYTFNLEAVKVKRRVVAPYTFPDGTPKQWEKGQDGNFRLTHPSNLWTDLTVPFWSMPENTDHPTQKPEKLLAKLILASSNCTDLVLDPFLGSGTTCVVAKKLGRRYVGIEQVKEYCLLAEKRLLLAERDERIQGYSEGVFWERNSLQTARASSTADERQFPLLAHNPSRES